MKTPQSVLPYPKAFSSEAMLHYHKRELHRDQSKKSINQSEIGNKSNNYIARFPNSNKGKEYIDSIKCSNCEETFSAGNIYIQHYACNHQGFPPEYIDKEQFICEDCPNIFMEKHSLHSHKYNVHGKGQIK